MAERLTITTKELDHATSTQLISLIDETNSSVVNGEAYVGNGYYSIYWQTNKSSEELLALTEECLAQYEVRQQELTDLSGQPASFEVSEENQDDPYFKGIIIFSTNKDGGAKREESVSYERPLSWQQIQVLLDDRKLRYVRINTPIGDFGVYADGKLGIISHIKQANGFAILLEKTSEKDVSKEDAERFYETVVSTVQGETSK